MYDSNSKPNANRGKKWNRSKFVQKMKRHGQRGVQLELDEYKYLSAILDNITRDKETEERQLMASNVMGQLKGKEIRTAMNLVGSRVLENLLVYTDEETFAPLMDLFAENFRVFCGDTFASHVLQRVLSIALLRAVAPLQIKQEPDTAEDEHARKKQKAGGGGEGWTEKCIWPGVEYCLQEEYSEQHRQQCRKFVERMTKFLMNNLEEFVSDCNASHAIRQVILHLAGITEKKAVEGSESKHLIVPEEWQKLLHEFGERILAWPQFVDLASTEVTAVLLQDLLRAVAITNDEFHLKQFLSKLYKEVFRPNKKETKYDPDSETQPDTSNLPPLFTNSSMLRVLEMCVAVAPAEFIKNKLYAKLFRNHVKQLAVSKTGNFAVQKLIDHTTEKDLMDLIFAELEDSLEQLLSMRHTGVLLAMARACGRLSCQQGKFVKLLLDALHCGESTPEKMIMAVLCLLPADGTNAPADSPNILLHGSLILQAILYYTKPIKFVTALLGMPNDRLAEIFLDQRGSFVANAFIESKFVGEKSREKMVRHLEGQYSRFALNIYGSRVVQIMFEAGSPEQRENIVHELAEECLAQLNNKVWSAKINKQLLVETYKNNPAQWRVLIKRDVKVTQMFNKLVDGKKRKLES
ncbi:nucleolar protein 9 [Anopheles stephensi]|uniref:nucleolar protein 9 n=1 Tax=Anopheles stephensi TaxID=30069 RepID=UPI0016589E0E|nr:nucleolar protein 9 [Anopheles stephensi]